MHRIHQDKFKYQYIDQPLSGANPGEEVMIFKGLYCKIAGLLQLHLHLVFTLLENS